MSNSAKQRAFFKQAIKLLEGLGCEVTIEQNKHYKAKISRNGKIGTWGVSTTPSNRFSAQRDAISDLKKILRDIGVDLENQNLGAGLIQMIIPEGKPSISQQLNLLIETDPFMNSSIFKDLLNHSYPNLTHENELAILNIFESLHNVVNPDFNQSATSNPDWAILNKDGNPNIACMKNVIIMTSDLSNRFPLKWNNAFSLTNGLENLINYYIRCQGITNLGLLITNVWRPGELFSYRTDIESFENKGIQSVAILISGNSTLPIAWPWR